MASDQQAKNVRGVGGPPVRVLVADDEHLVAMGLASNLRTLGIDVLGPVPDGQAALELARQDRPDAALLDIRMPNLDGISAARTLYKEMGVPTVIVSAFSDQQHIDEIIAHGDETGVFAYLLKPVSQDDLRVALTLMMHRSRMDEARMTRINQLERSLANRRTVEQAKWKLVEQCGFSEAQAHEHLQRTARSARRTLAEIAQEVLDCDDLTGGPRDCPD